MVYKEIKVHNLQKTALPLMRLWKTVIWVSSRELYLLLDSSLRRMNLKTKISKTVSNKIPTFPKCYSSKEGLHVTQPLVLKSKHYRKQHNHSGDTRRNWYKLTRTIPRSGFLNCSLPSCNAALQIILGINRLSHFKTQVHTFTKGIIWHGCLW